jgi:hypothetical protein
MVERVWSWRLGARGLGEEGGRRKEEGGRRKEEGGGRKEGMGKGREGKGVESRRHVG